MKEGSKPAQLQLAYDMHVLTHGAQAPRLSNDKRGEEKRRAASGLLRAALPAHLSSTQAPCQSPYTPASVTQRSAAQHSTVSTAEQQHSTAKTSVNAARRDRVTACPAQSETHQLSRQCSMQHSSSKLPCIQGWSCTTPLRAAGALCEG